MCSLLKIHVFGLGIWYILHHMGWYPMQAITVADRKHEFEDVEEVHYKNLSILASGLQHLMT